jgi:hypothetical protein
MTSPANSGGNCPASKGMSKIGKWVIFTLMKFGGRKPLATRYAKRLSLPKTAKLRKTFQPADG